MKLFSKSVSVRVNKLNSIKSQIVEITDFVESALEDKNKKIFVNKNSNIENNQKDTFILSKIVNTSAKSSSQLNDIVFIKDELNIIKLMLSKQEKTLEMILLKIK